MIIRRKVRRGISLLEVLVSLAIFMLSIVVISQMVDSAARSAVRSKHITQAGIYCEAKMAEIVIGTQPLSSTGFTSLENADAGWQYAINCEPQTWSNVTSNNTSINGLNLVRVTVRFENEVEHSLTRVVLDPQLRVPIADPTSNSSSSASGSGSGSASGAGSGSGGSGAGGSSGGGGKAGGGSGGGKPGGSAGGAPAGGSTGAGRGTGGAPTPAPTGGKTGGK
jgi:Tfp pilus assembly protein PilV